MSLIGNGIAPNGRSVRSRGGSKERRSCYCPVPARSKPERARYRTACDSLLNVGRTYPCQLMLQTVGVSEVGVVARSGAPAIAQSQPDRNQRRQGIAHRVRQPTNCWSDVPLPTFAPNGRSVRSRGDSKKQSFCYCPVPA